MSKKLKIFAMSILALLVFSSITLLADKAEKDAWPSIASSKPSGMMAFAELLSRDGYEIELSQSVFIDRDPEALIIAPYIAKELEFGDFDFEEMEESTSENSSVFAVNLNEFMKAGGTVIAIGVPQKFNDASLYPVTHRVEIDEESLEVDTNSEAGMIPGWAFPDEFPDSISSMALVREVGDGRLIRLSHGIGVTNRFLDQNDTAEFYLNLIRSAAPEGATIVFAEAAFGNSSGESVFDLFGGWTKAARWQALLLLAMIGITLGMRFGLPVWEKPRQFGAREMVDALGSMLQRAKKPQYALNLILNEAFRRIRRVQKIPRSTTIEQMLRGVPPELAKQVTLAQSLSSFDTASTSECLMRAKKLLKEVSLYEADSRRSA
jgi:hypothetical protein